MARAEREITLAAGESREWNVRLELERLAATVIVTAQAEPAAAAAVSAPVTVLTREEIRERQFTSLGPALAAATGAAFSRLGREGGVTSLFFGGGNSNFTKVLVDGTTVNEPGGAVDYSQFALDNIEKIEIVRGAESALYGSDAMTGVVQIFTRRGESRRPRLELEAEGGSFATARGAANVSGRWRALDFSLAAGRFETRGPEVNDRFRNSTLSGNLGWRPEERHALRLSVRSASTGAGVAGQTLFTPPNLDQYNGLRHFSANLSWEFTTGARWRHRVSGTESYARQLFDNPASDFCFATPPFICDFPFTSRNQLNRAGFAQQSSFAAPRGGFAFGYQYEVENGFLGALHARRNNHAGYLEARWQFFSRLTATAGVRAEANDSFGTRVVPRLGLVYILRTAGGPWGSTRLRFSTGLGIKEPSLVQSFADDPCFPGNAGLRPERSRAVNAGVEQTALDDRLRFSVDYFHNAFRDIVSFTSCFTGGPCPIPPPPACVLGFYGTFFNTDRARARGIQTSLEARPAPWLRLLGQYSFVDSRVLQAPNAFDPALAPGNRLFKRPVHSGSLVLSADWKKMNWNLSAYFTGPRTDSDFLSIRFGNTCTGPCMSRNPGYARLDLAGTYRLHARYSLFARIENLFDRDYQDSLGYAAMGRHIRGGVRVVLGGE